MFKQRKFTVEILFSPLNYIYKFKKILNAFLFHICAWCHHAWNRIHLL